MASISENQSFSDYILDRNSMLDSAAAWISKNMVVGDVFDETDITDYVAAKCRPEEVFNSTDLEQWAMDNGFKRDY
jgi:hypothetical protein